jgi:hypothetical protein
MEKMKRALLPGFDPLPHALSTKGLSALVAVVVLGTGFMVQRYVESSQATSQATSTPTSKQSSSPSSARFDRPSEVQAAPTEGNSYGYAAPSSRSNESHSRGCCGWRATTTAPHARVESASTQVSQPTTPSLFQPEGDSVGG